MRFSMHPSQRPALFISIFAACLLLWAASPRPAHAQGRRLAVLVGIEHFQDLAITDLQYTHRDVSMMKSWLLDPGGGGFRPEDIRVLLNSRATLDNLVSLCDSLIQHTTPDDMVLIYISSHGFFTDDKGGMGVALHDSKSVGFGPDGPILQRSTTLTSSFVKCLLERLPAGRRILIADLCHSAKVADGIDWTCDLRGRPVYAAHHDKLKGTSIHQGPGGQVTVIAASCQSRQKAWESRELGSSIFTYYLVRGLKNEKGDLMRAFAFAKQQTQRQANDEKGHAQIPMLMRYPAHAKLDLSAAGIALR